MQAEDRSPYRCNQLHQQAISVDGPEEGVEGVGAWSRRSPMFGVGVCHNTLSIGILVFDDGEQIPLQSFGTLCSDVEHRPLRVPQRGRSARGVS